MIEYRVCENCEYLNEVSNLQCESCGADISFVSPAAIDPLDAAGGPAIPEQVKENIPPTSSSPARGRGTQIMPRSKLVNKKDGFEIRIPAAGCILGREGDVSPDYFDGNSNFVSRRHLRIFSRGDSYYIVDENSSNHTWFNGEILEPGREYALKSGGSLIMADMEFLLILE